ncbi:GNAT family N-acetyltransferase [Polynucleobacter paneuropaeus]|nr:GNAT family N-acetyltransferase [Polynucleobacter paneuropaeus]
MQNDWPVFHEAWWLDAVVGPNNWGECLVERNGELLARLPWSRRRKNGFVYCDDPKLTPFLGPWFKKPIDGTSFYNILSREKELTNALIKQLPSHDYFRYCFSPEITNWQPWYWRGYSATTFYTYRLNDMSNLDGIFSRIKGSTRTSIRNAHKSHLEILPNSTIDDFIELNEMTFRRQGLQMPYTKIFLHNLDAACCQHNARKILTAIDSQGRKLASIFLVYNKHAAYNLMLGSNPNFHDTGAVSFLLWEAIKFASTVSKIFDFEGSMMESIESFYRSFGAKQTPYYSVSRTPNRLLAIGQSGVGIIKEIIK